MRISHVTEKSAMLGQMLPASEHLGESGQLWVQHPAAYLCPTHRGLGAVACPSSHTGHIIDRVVGTCIFGVPELQEKVNNSKEKSPEEIETLLKTRRNVRKYVETNLFHY